MLFGQKKDLYVDINSKLSLLDTFELLDDNMIHCLTMSHESIPEEVQYSINICYNNFKELAIRLLSNSLDIPEEDLYGHIMVDGYGAGCRRYRSIDRSLKLVKSNEDFIEFFEG